MRLLQPQRNKVTFPVPKDYPELIALAQTPDAVSRCKCDICFPRIYRSKLRCPLPGHSRLKPKTDPARNMHGNECYKALKPSLIPPGYEVMHFVRSTISYFDRPAESLCNVHIDALQRLNAWIHDNIQDIFTVHPPPSAFDTLLPAQTMREIWTSLNLLFFGRDTPSLALPLGPHRRLTRPDTPGKSTHRH